ncbi:hypothetical protein LguiA_033616 [Lonicera macranthoides]
MEGSDEGTKADQTLPAGFRFHPTDEELITCYLINKISDSSFTGRAITDVDLNKCEPWDLPGKAKMGEKEWYFFSLRDRKYPTGVRTNRATNTGYWKTTGKDKEIYNTSSVNSSELVGMKKTLVFYRGRAPRGEKTNWVMHEYRIHSKSAFRTAKDEWVVCRVFQKSAGGKKYPSSHSSRTTLNPYHLEMGPNAAMPSSSHLMDGTNGNFQFPMSSRTYMSNADMAELQRVLRGSASTGINMPMHPQFNYPLVHGGGGGVASGGGGGVGGECFTISGLNINLGGTPGAGPPFMRPGPAMSQQDVGSNMMGQQNDVVGYGGGGEMNNPNGFGNRFMGMDGCGDMDSYWPPY